MNTNTHRATVTPAKPETRLAGADRAGWPAPSQIVVAGDDAYRIDCSVCGTVATYRGEQFTLVEARRHVRYFENLEG